MVALYYGVVPTKVRKTPRDLAQTSIYATLHQHRTLRCGGERRRRRVSGAFRTNHRRAMGELYQVKGDGPNQPGPDGAPVHRRQGVVHPRTRGILTDEYMHGGTIGTTINRSMCLPGLRTFRDPNRPLSKSSLRCGCCTIFWSSGKLRHRTRRIPFAVQSMWSRKARRPSGVAKTPKRCSIQFQRIRCPVYGT
jgi:hypothetical protein